MLENSGKALPPLQLSSRIGGHMDPEKFESIEFNCQFFTITAWKEGIKQKTRRRKIG